MGGNVKGSGWLSCREYFEKTIGVEGIQKVIQALEPADQQAFAKTILPGSWTSYDAFIHFLLKADSLFGKGDNKMIAAANIYSARKILRGFTNL